MSLLQVVFLTNDVDKWVWENEVGEPFSTKSIRKEIDRKSSVCSDGGSFRWNTWAPLKVNYHSWRAESGRLAAKVSLANRGISVPNILCSRCGLREETPDNIFAECLWAKSVW
ncbi:putative reverse transcriptase zinc-binding domain-containing protein [Helianthus anomalus]